VPITCGACAERRGEGHRAKESLFSVSLSLSIHRTVSVVLVTSVEWRWRERFQELVEVEEREGLLACVRASGTMKSSSGHVSDTILVKEVPCLLFC